MLERFNPNHPK
jgi:hypothetical protein